MGWFGATGRIVLLAAIGLLFGWIYGYPLQAVLLVFVGLVAFGIYELNSVQRWLQDPVQPPPDAIGLWGELMARIYAHQRRHRDIQQQLTANLEYLQDSLSSMRDGVIMVDELGAIKWLNQAVEPLLGLRHPEDTGQTLTNLVRNPEFNSYFLQGDYSAPLQYSVGAAPKTHLRVEITNFGKGERLLFIRDVSEAVRLEQMRRDFVANVSHELRTPLTVITGYVDTLLDSGGELAERYQKPLQQMSQQAGRMETLLKDLLWLSRIESEKRTEEHEPVDIGGLLQELKDELSTTFAQRRIELELSTDQKILGDYRELYSAISNLVVNALKYSKDDSIVTIRWYSTGTGFIVEVADQGIGIDAAHIPRLTERFYRVDDSRSSVTGGTGLGLAIVKHVMAAHGGEILIDSVLSKGSTFKLVFPGRDHGDRTRGTAAAHIGQV